MNIKKMIKKDIVDVSILASLLYHSSIEEIIEDFNSLINKVYEKCKGKIK